MKKFMFFALASAAMLASCSSDDTIALDESNVAQAQDGPVAIQLGLGQVEITRGTGTVGGTTAALNKWHSQKFNVFMLVRDTMAVAQDVAGDIFNDAEFIAPSGLVTGVAKTYTGTTELTKYYPATGEYDFWGYRLDGADTTANAVITTDKITRDFKIDGSQDIMAAWADTAGVKKAFSAYSARKGNQPELIFKHLLTRLHFCALAGNENSAETDALITDTAVTTAVVVDSIKVTSKSEGTLTIAHLDLVAEKDGTYNRIAWTDGSEEAMILKQRKDSTANVDSLELEALKPIILHGTGTGTGFAADSTFVGEALLVAPATSYEMTVCVSQRVEVQPGVFEKRYDKIDATLNVAGGFEKGKSYQVNVKVYGLEKIIVNVTLTPWIEGPSILVDPETL